MDAHLIAGHALLACSCASKPAPAVAPQVASAPRTRLDPAQPAPAPGVLTALLAGRKDTLRSLPRIEGLMIDTESGRVTSATEGEVYAIGTRAAMAAITARGICVQVIQDEIAYARHLETVLREIVDVERSDGDADADVAEL